MATKVSLKVSFNGDVRKITSSPQDLHAAIAQRYGLSGDLSRRIELSHQDRPVDIDWIVALMSTLEPGKPLKVTMSLAEEAEDLEERDAPPTYDETVHEGIWCDNCSANPIHGARHWKQLNGDTYDLCDPCFNELDDDKKAELKLKDQATNQPAEAAKNATEELATPYYSLDGCDGKEANPDPKVLWQMAEDAKSKAHATKQEAKKIAVCAMEDAKKAKHALNAAKKAEKAALKAEALAKKQALKAEALAKKELKQQAKKEAKKEAKAAKDSAKVAAAEVTHGKLVNWFAKDCPATTGELIVLPCGRLCFHADSHPGNLRVNETLDVQRNGGRGPWAQFEAIPTQEKPEVFRLLSQQHRDSECFLGVDEVDEWGNSDPSLWTACGIAYEFVLVPPDSKAGLWSFYPDGHHTPIEISPPTPLPQPREVYQSIQEYIQKLAASTGIPISMGDAPEKELELVEMLNLLHEELPHGLKRIAMKKLGLRQFEIPTEPEAAEWSEDWDLMLQDLHDMGFESSEQNMKAVINARGDIKQAVKQLRMQELASRNA